MIPARMQSAYEWMVKIHTWNDAHDAGGLGMLSITASNLAGDRPTAGTGGARPDAGGRCPRRELAGDGAEAVQAPVGERRHERRADDGAVGVGEDLRHL